MLGLAQAFDSHVLLTVDKVIAITRDSLGRFLIYDLIGLFVMDEWRRLLIHQHQLETLFVAKTDTAIERIGSRFRHTKSKWGYNRLF